MFRTLGFLILSVSVVAVLGCAGGGGTPLDTVKVSGTVTLDGAPVEGAKVVFAPKDASGMAASGVTDSSGNYKLTTRDPGDGALEGSYAVMISKTEVDEGAVADAVQPGMSDEEATEAAMKAHVAGGEAEAESRDLLPAKYKTPSESGLTADVSKGAENTFDFQLTSE